MIQVPKAGLQESDMSLSIMESQEEDEIDKSVDYDFMKQMAEEAKGMSKELR